MEISNVVDSEHLAKLITEAKKVAIEYRQLMGRPLGITGEIAEYEAPQRVAHADPLHLQQGRRRPHVLTPSSSSSKQVLTQSPPDSATADGKRPQ